MAELETPERAKGGAAILIGTAGLVTTVILVGEIIKALW
jgi:hypothetical protein